MSGESVFPGFPPGVNPQPPMVYIETKGAWEYKQIVFNLIGGQTPGEDELNKIGAEGWELAGVLSYSPFAHFYFKRPVSR